MARVKRDSESMFYDFDDLSREVKMLGGIVQNAGHTPCDEELLEWVNNLNNTVNKINTLKEDVVRYYQD